MEIVRLISNLLEKWQTFHSTEVSNLDKNIEYKAVRIHVQDGAQCISYYQLRLIHELSSYSARKKRTTTHM